MAVYRPDPELLRRQLVSLREQTLAEWECVVGVDGKDDEVVALVAGTVGDDERFHVRVDEPRVGHYRQFERLLEQVPADASWVALSDQDDVWAPDKLARLVCRLGPAALVQGEAWVESVDGTQPRGRAVRRPVRRLSALLADNQVTGSFAVLRPDVLGAALPFPAPTPAAYHDHWLAVCAHLAGGVVTVQEPLQTYVQHGANVLGEQGGRSMTSRWRSLVQGASGRRTSPLQVVADERWAWRVRMARAAVERFDDVDPEDRATLEAFAAGAASVPLARLVLADVVRGRVSRTRALALLAGALWVSAHGGRTA
ncbi:glycosyltransferase [Cellulomonas sp. JZ18]|uniref:glycosyltransferase n=1 Tax=Cellulomonas sp. JZ18 TaxID=2654191 RepID=UPI0012D46799|nr:glycosyltransferase [Cellulomonas sp. JZ18]QGQ20262.1 glycosyltransferase [Cellulomonas sp. JZ18]